MLGVTDEAFVNEATTQVKNSDGNRRRIGAVDC